MTDMSALMDEAMSYALVRRALSLSLLLFLEDIPHGRFQRLDQLDNPDESATCAYLEQFSSPPFLLRQFCTDATNSVKRKRLRVECASPLTRQYALLLANDRPVTNCTEAAPLILYHAGVEKDLNQEDLLCAQDLLESLCQAVGLDAACQFDPMRLATLPA